MKDEDRPYILFERTHNKGMTDKAAKFDANGKQTRGAFKGEHVVEQRKALVDRRPPFSPYVWATADWVMHQTHPSKGAKIIGYGNFEKLPHDYPKEWKEQLARIVPIVQPLAQAQEMLKLAQAQLEIVKQQQVRLDEQTGQQATKLPGQEEGSRRLPKARKKPLGPAGETADHAAS